MLIPIVSAATLAVVLLSACDEPAAPAAAIRPVRAVTVEPVDIGQALSQTGEIQPRYETDLGFRIGGQILARPVDVASVIGRGDLGSHQRRSVWYVLHRFLQEKREIWQPI